MLRRLTLAPKIALGFGLMLVLLAVVGVAGFLSMRSNQMAFAAFGEIVGEGRALAEIDRAATRVRLEVLHFVSSRSQSDPASAKAAFAALDAVIVEAAPASARPSFAAALAELGKQKAAYAAAFDQLAAARQESLAVYQKEFSQRVFEFRRALGMAQMTLDREKNLDASKRIGGILNSILFANTYALHYYFGNDGAMLENFQKEIGELNTKMDDLQGGLGESRAVKMVAKAREDVGEFVKIFEKLTVAIKHENAALAEQLKPAEDALAASSEQAVTTGLAEETTIGEGTQGEIARAKLAILVVVGLAALAGGFLAFFMGRSIARPILRLAETMRRLAVRDYATAIEGAERRDEIGRMAEALVVFKDGLERSEALAAEQRAEQEAKEQRQLQTTRVTRDFAASVDQVVAAVSTEASAVRRNAESLSLGTGEMTAQAAAAAAAAAETNANVQTVASAAEELSQSIRMISEQVQRATGVAIEAVASADATSATVRNLAAAADRIGEVVGLITEVAAQTNLLALNATIEAARAGEAGKGFAVVASEVKSLSSRTAKATEEIQTHITAIQRETGDVVGAIAKIGTVIGSISEITTAVAAAVEEQQAATQEIARNVQQAAVGTVGVTENITSVSAAADRNGAAAKDMLSAADQLSSQSTTLRKEFDSFTSNMKAA